MASVVEFVALGPGGAHLVTAHALAALHAVQHVYYPELGGKSQARELLVQLGVPGEKLRGYTLPMSHNREAALKAYAQVAQEVTELALQEHSIAIVAEGDVSIYSSTHYIATQLEERGISIRHHAGIPSFIAAASALNISLVEGNEMLVVSPGQSLSGATTECSRWGRHPCRYEAIAMRGRAKSPYAPLCALHPILLL